MGNNVTLSESLVITVFSMLVVFVVLILISYLIRILKVASIGKKDKVQTTESNIMESKVVEKEEVSKTDDEELVAVIAAAVAANLGVSVPQIRIKEIKRVYQNTPLWAETGRREQIKGI